MDKYPKDFLERNLHLDRRSYEDVVNLATEYGKPIDSVRLPPCSNFGFSDTQETSRVGGWPMLMFRPERSYESFLYAAPSFCQRVSARIPNIALSQILNTTLREETQFQKNTIPFKVTRIRKEEYVMSISPIKSTKQRLFFLIHCYPSFFFVFLSPISKKEYYFSLQILAHFNFNFPFPFTFPVIQFSNVLNSQPCETRA